MQRVHLPLQFHSLTDAFAEMSTIDDHRINLATEACNDNHTILGDRVMRYREMVELAPEATLVFLDGKLALLNQAGCRLIGSPNSEALIGKSLLDFIHPDFHGVWLNSLSIEPGHAGIDTSFVEQVWLRLDGTPFDAELTTGRLTYEDAPALQITIRDISSRKFSEKLQLGENRILNMIATGAPLQDILTSLAKFAETASGNGKCSVMSFNSEESTLSTSVAPSAPNELVAAMDRVQIGPQNGSCSAAAFRAEPVVANDIRTDPVWANHRDQALRHGLNASASWPVFGKNKKILGTFALYFHESSALSTQTTRLLDICANLAGIAIDSRISEDRIRYLAHYDGLTSLPNRFLFSEYLELALRNAQRNQRKFAVFFIDLDKFKEVNDTLGHDAGDEVLRETARRLRNSLRHTDKIARMGGDEFYVLIEELANSSYAIDVAAKLLNETAKPMLIQGQLVEVNMSIGIAIYPDHGLEAQALLANADSAMYSAKEAGKNGYRLFTVPKQVAADSIGICENAFVPENQARLTFATENDVGMLR